MLDCLVDLDISPYEYCFLNDDTNQGSGSFRVYVPKLMPRINRGDSRTETLSSDNNIFVNAPTCKPNASTRLTGQNYVTVKRTARADLSFKGDYYNIIRKGARFMMIVMDGNIRDMYITDNV